MRRSSPAPRRHRGGCRAACVLGWLVPARTITPPLHVVRLRYTTGRAYRRQARRLAEPVPRTPARPADPQPRHPCMPSRSAARARPGRSHLSKLKQLRGLCRAPRRSLPRRGEPDGPMGLALPETRLGREAFHAALVPAGRAAQRRPASPASSEAEQDPGVHRPRWRCRGFSAFRKGPATGGAARGSMWRAPARS